MSDYCCSECEYKSCVKSNMERHINNKCKNAKIIVVKVNIICEYCKKSLTTMPNLKKHLKTCKIKKTNLEEEVKSLKEKLLVAEALAKKPTTINNNTQININLAPWNDPLLPGDVERYYRESVKKIFLAVPTLIKYIHFNTEHPENHNICIKNGRSKTAKVYNGKEWETIDEDQLITTLINDYEQTLEDFSEVKKLTFTKKYQEIKDRDGEEKVYDDLHNEVKRVIYDRNHMVKIKN
jgi:hypothetical protein